MVTPLPTPLIFTALLEPYMTFTRLDIAYVVQQVCLHMHDSLEPHLTALKCIVRYI